ncbi:MAG: hypothetical protein WC758_05965 [Candidatus Woesearchaeota archaeon]|jgi:hypothetical protein
MVDNYGFWGQTEYNLSFMQQNVELLIYSALAFLTPFLIGHPQMVVGVLVNAALVLATLNIKDYRLLPVIMLPSLAVLSRGVIFGPFTIFLIYMIPFVWIGNTILVYAFKELKLKRKINSIITLIIGAALKTVFLFSVAFILVKSGVIPAPFLVSMGLLQLYTALIGGGIALGIHEAKKRINSVI